MSVEIDDVVVTHAGRRLVDVPHVRLEPGRPVTVVGESGSGKSLLAQAVMGTLAPGLAVSGRLRLDRRDLDLADRAGRRTLWGRELAILPQEPVLALDPTMRVLPQVAEGRRGDAPRRSWRRQPDPVAVRALADLGLAGTERSYPHTLSGGMAQRVAFAAATIGGARLLIADEPSKGLDVVARDRLADLLARHVDGGGHLLTITHDLDLARRLGGDVLVMREATVVESGPVEEVLTRPRHPWTRRLLAAEPSRWTFGWQDAPAPADGEVVLGLDRVGKRYGGTVLFEDLSLEVRSGERWALTGPSGSGKTTLAGVALGLTRPDSGTVRHAPVLAGGRLQKLYQDPTQSFPARVTTGTALDDVLRRHRLPRARLLGLLEELRLPEELLGRRPGAVSGGELQRLAVARAMLLRPALLLADEPTSRLDLLTQAETVDLLLREVVEHGCALVLVTHDPALAARTCPRSVELPLGPVRAGYDAATRPGAGDAGAPRPVVAGVPSSRPRAASSGRTPSPNQ